MFSASALPVLKGSEKQVTWAHGLRIDALNAVTPESISLEAQIKQGVSEDIKPILERLISGYSWFFIETHDEARWWIDNRQGNHHDWTKVVATGIEVYMRQHVKGADVWYEEGRGWRLLPKRPTAPAPEQVIDNDPWGNSVPEGHCPNCLNDLCGKQECAVCGWAPMTRLGQ